MSGRLLPVVRQAATSLDTLRDGPQIVSEASVQLRFNRRHKVANVVLARGCDEVGGSIESLHTIPREDGCGEEARSAFPVRISPSECRSVGPTLGGRVLKGPGVLGDELWSIHPPDVGPQSRSSSLVVGLSPRVFALQHRAAGSRMAAVRARSCSQGRPDDRLCGATPAGFIPWPTSLGVV